MPKEDAAQAETPNVLGFGASPSGGSGGGHPQGYTSRNLPERGARAERRSGLGCRWLKRAGQVGE